MPPYSLKLLCFDPRDLAAVCPEEINKPRRLIEQPSSDREMMLSKFGIPDRLKDLAADVLPSTLRKLKSPVVAELAIASASANWTLEERWLALAYSCLASPGSAPSTEPAEPEEDTDTNFFLCSGESAAPSRTA